MHQMSPFFYVLTLTFLFGTPIVIFAMKYFSAAYQARQKARADEAYRALAEKAATAQSENTASLSAMRADLASVATRLAAIEKILKAVE